MFGVMLPTLLSISFCSQAAFVDFETGMLPNTAKDEVFVRENGNWRLGKKLYTEFISCPAISDTPKIPHVLHHIWLGSPMPAVCVQMRETWYAHNPTWQGILWTDNEENYIYGLLVTSVDELHEALRDRKVQRIVCDVRNLTLAHWRAYNDTTNYGERSDIIRYEVLYAFGGLYVDTDFECLKSFDFFHATCDFYAGVGYSKTYGLLNGLIGCAVGDRIIRTCIEDLVGKAHPNDTSSVIGRTGPGLLTRSFFKAHRSGYQGVAVGFPVTTFYPWPNWDRGNNSSDVVQSWVCPESYGVHYWHVSWQRNQYK